MSDLKQEAVEILERTFLELPEGRHNGSAARLVDCLVGAALEGLKAELVAARQKQKEKQK